MSNESSVLAGCEVLPPMERQAERADDSRRLRSRRSANRKQTEERFHLLNTFVDFTMGSLRRTDIAVWLVLYRDSRGGIARTAQTDIAARSGVCRVTVSRAIKRLAGRGLVFVVHRGGLHRGVSSYRVNALDVER